MRRWTLTTTGWASCNHQPVFFIWTMPGLDNKDQQRHRQQVVDALNTNEAQR